MAPQYVLTRQSIAASCLSFRTFRPLFSMSCSLFCQKTGGWVYASQSPPKTERIKNDTRLTQLRFHFRTLPISHGDRSPVLFTDRRSQFLVLRTARVLSTQRIRKLP